MKKTIYFASFIMLLCACVDTSLDSIPVTGVIINQEEARVFLGHELVLTATVIPSNATEKNLIWESSDEEIVSVDGGVVNALAIGTATITAKTKDRKFSASCVITVTKECQTQTKGPIVLDLGTVLATSAEFSGTLDTKMLADYDMDDGGIGFIYAPVGVSLKMETAKKISISPVNSGKTFTKIIENLKYDTEYHYTIFLYKNNVCQYGETQKFRTADVSIEVDDVAVTPTSVTFIGKLDRDLVCSKYLRFGIDYSTNSNFSSSTTKSINVGEVSFSKTVSGLVVGTTYYYRTYICQDGNYEYSEKKSFLTTDVSVEITDVEPSATSVTIKGKIIPVSACKEVTSGIQLHTSPTVSSSSYVSGYTLSSSVIATDGSFTVQIKNLDINTPYYIRSYVFCNNEYLYGDMIDFKTTNVTIDLTIDNITCNSVTLNGKCSPSSIRNEAQIRLYLAPSSAVSANYYSEMFPLKSSDISSSGLFTIPLEDLTPEKSYYVRSYIIMKDVYYNCGVKSFTTEKLVVPVAPSGFTNLSADATSNCYIVSQGGSYCLLATKGNQPANLLHSTESASVLWESFGTSTTPSVGDLIKSVSYDNGYITFLTADTFKEGNAVIAAKDASGTILWSWHIWFTDQPQEQVYNNNAGTMMDRNLGATSITNNDIGALGLLYQWGRKDPFLGSSTLSSKTVVSKSVAKSTISWPAPVSTGTIAYVTSHPTTFVYGDNDWYFGNYDTPLWTTSSKAKSIYDPCPAGWRVPDGGRNSVWAKARGDLGSFFSIYPFTPYDDYGFDFYYYFTATTNWYPASGIRDNSGESLMYVGRYGYYWSASLNLDIVRAAYCMHFSDDGCYSWTSINRVTGLSVRCIKE